MWEGRCIMQRQSSRITYVFPGGFPQRPERFQEESDLSWAELARRLGTSHSYTTMADPRLDVARVALQT